MKKGNVTVYLVAYTSVVLKDIEIDEDNQPVENLIEKAKAQAKDNGVDWEYDDEEVEVIED